MYASKSRIGRLGPVERGGGVSEEEGGKEGGVRRRGGRRGEEEGGEEGGVRRRGGRIGE
jgi:hypothetical protein